MRVAAILVAAGSGTRFGSDVPKQFTPLLGRPLARWSAEALLRGDGGGGVLPGMLQPVGDPVRLAHALDGLGCRPAVPGGATRQASVRAGLAALAPLLPDVVLVHDAARPIVPAGTVAALLSALGDHPGAIPAVAVADTLKRVEDGRIVATVPRDGLWRAQTPQAFRYDALVEAHRASPESDALTDDASALEAAGRTVAVVPGAEDNLKLTYSEDLVRLERLLAARLEPRTGTGFDVHRFADGPRPMVLCGVVVPHPRGLAGHSDADVGIHALCDAIYGALADGDIGRHFPPSEAAWKDADSARFLLHAAERVRQRGGVLTNADVTLVCEQPKITPHAPAMRARLADLLGVDLARVSVKATTTERLGFAGRSEGIAAQAVATVLVPPA